MAVARRLDRYELIEEIGTGGMATVFRARDSELEREVAVKVLHPHLASQPDAQERFQREAKAVAKLHHTNILDIYDYSGAESEESYIVVELIHGPTLKRFVEGARLTEDPVRTRRTPVQKGVREDASGARRTPIEEGVGRVPTEVAVMIVHEICAAVAAAHEHGIIHRDIKPENVMIREDGVVKLTDFGIAQILDANSMTVTGQILGSPAHMAPEQIEAQEIDFRADIFSIGTVLYYLAAGRLPFEGRNPHHLLKKIMDGDYPDPVRVEPSMGEGLAAIIRRCLARNPDGRYESAEALREELAKFLRGLELPDPSHELKEYFRDPHGYAEAHRERIVRVLIRRGREARRQGELPAALDCFNRVLAIDEDNQEVLRLVGGIERRKKVLRFAVGAAGIALLGAAAGLGWRAMANDGSPRRAGADVSDPVGEERDPPDDSIDPRPGDEVPQAEAEARTTRPGLRAVGKTPSAPPVQKTRRVTFNPGLCQNVHVIVDGRDLGEFSDVLSTELRIGDHTVEYRPNENVPCEGAAFSVHVAPGETEQPIPWRTFRWSPARVKIETNVPAKVSIPGRHAVTDASSPFDVRMQDVQEELVALVEADGHFPHRESLNLRAGEITSVAVTLRPRPGTEQETP